MDALRLIFARFGVEVDTGPLDQMDKSVNGLVGQLRQLGAVVAGGAVVSALRSFVETTTNAFDTLNDSAARLQISTDALQELQYAAKLSGIEAGQLEAAVGALTRSLQGVAEGSDKPEKILKKLGVSAKDAQGGLRTVSDLLPEIADGISKLPNDTERAGAAIRLFGRGGLALLPLLKQGRAGLAELRAEFKNLGGGASQEAIAAMAEYRDQVDRSDAATEALKVEIALKLLPLWRAFVDAGLKASAMLTEVARRTHLFEIALAGAGTAIAIWSVRTVIALAPVLAPILAISAGVAAIVLALDDLWTTFEGGESALQGFIDGMYGAGTTAEVVDGLIMLWDDLVTAILEAGQATKEFLGLGKAEPVEDRQQKRARERQEAQDKAVESGDVNAFARSRQAAGRTTQEGMLGEFKERRRAMIASGRVKATAADVQAGLADSKGRATAAPVREAARPGAFNTDAATGQVDAASVMSMPAAARVMAAPMSTQPARTVHQTTTVTVNLPPGSDRDQAERLRKVAQDVLQSETRKAGAALLGTPDPEWSVAP
jgi:hypothetical protein